ncbi:MAG TPA: helix-turn-helix domain-containing protein [Acetobacteraceae bacterium]|nr:helix-turn-helix domain-containing protein [Acetobacteraceae bacterium]
MHPKFSGSVLTVVPDRDREVMRSLASELRLQILQCIRRAGRMNVNEVCEALGLPQSTVAANIQVLERSGLVESTTAKGRKGQQKVCRVPFEEIVLRLNSPEPASQGDTIEVAMPVGLYTSCSVTAPCGLCSTEHVIGLLDVPDHLLDPDRMRAALLWFWRGYVEYKFPNNAKVLQADVEAVEFSMEMSSEVPGTNVDWPSDITVWVNGVKIGTWTSPGDFGDRRGTYTPRWWKLGGSQYGKLTNWRISAQGTFMDGAKLSPVTLEQLDLDRHHSVKLRIGIDEHAAHPGGVNIFGRGFGNHDQDIVMRLYLNRH